MSPETEHHAEPHRSGHKWFDIAIALGLFFVSVSSLYVAAQSHKTLEEMVEANKHLVEANKRLVEANSWPFLAYGTGDYPDKINFVVRNDGVGPAKIETAEVIWKGIPYGDPISVLAACCGLKVNIKDLSTSLIAGRVLRAGESVTFLEVPKTKTDTLTWTRLDNARLSPNFSVHICYCSVFDECWTEDLARMSLRPRRADRCEVPRIPYTIGR